jgi:Zn finger protein HypA/HybF involved in hydrogenase expression
MHELGIACRIVDIACDTARSRGGRAVTAIFLELGDECGAVGELLQSSMAIACKGTMAEDSRVIIRSVQGTSMCVRSIQVEG